MRKRNISKKFLFIKIILLIIIIILILLITFKKDNILKNGIININGKKNKVLDIIVNKIDINDENINITFNKDVKCSLDEKTFKSSEEKICSFYYDENIGKIYVKDKDKKNKTLDLTDYISFYKKTKDNYIYVALGATENISYLYKNLDMKVVKSSVDSIISVSEDGLIKGENLGESTITIKSKEFSVDMKVLVTSLISVKGLDFNYDKSYLSCGLYTKEDNDLLDKILESRVNRGGYGTRAGAVEAARFLTMEFPYRINYFSENGRMADWPKVDGEGRFYHKGLYLHESRFDVLNQDLIMNGPNPWGCPIYSNPSKGNRSNGLDCSGFITWALYNGGFDPSDMGAGIDPYNDLTDLGEKERIPDVINSLKVGDLLSGDGEVSGAYYGGHIAMLIGIKDGYYYVAEELWGRPSLSHGAVAMKYSLDDFIYYFYWRVNMDNYYGSDGNISDYWY